jgi:hypothetical protein
MIGSLPQLRKDVYARSLPKRQRAPLSGTGIGLGLTGFLLKIESSSSGVPGFYGFSWILVTVSLRWHGILVVL